MGRMVIWFKRQGKLSMSLQSRSEGGHTELSRVGMRRADVVKLAPVVLHFLR